MDPTTARCRTTGPSRPAAVPLLTPPEFPETNQPTLPWSVPPQLLLQQDSPLAPQLREVAISLASGVIEVLRGQRATIQLEFCAEPEVLRLLEQLRRGSDLSELRLLSVRVQSPHPDALEVSAHLAHQGRSRAAALRINRQQGRWVTTQLMLALSDKVQQAGRGRFHAG